MSRYPAEVQIDFADDTPRHFAPTESWREREAKADKSRARRERAKRTVRRRAGPPESPRPDSLHATPPPTRKEDDT